MKEDSVLRMASIRNVRAASGRYFAAWLLRYYQALTTEYRKICVVAPELETRQSAREMVKQILGDWICFAANDLENETLMGVLSNSHEPMYWNLYDHTDSKGDVLRKC